MRKAAVLLAILALAPALTHAAPITVTTTPCTVDDVTYAPDGVSPHAAFACVGSFVGNDSPGSLPFGPWIQEDSVKAEGASDPMVGTVGYLGYTWTLQAEKDQDGSWHLSVSPNLNLPITGVDFLVVLKGSTQWSAYLFQDEEVYAENGGEFEITFRNNGGQISNLSHMSLYLRDGVPTIPEPASMLLLGSGLVGLAGAIRRRTRK